MRLALAPLLLAMLLAAPAASGDPPQPGAPFSPSGSLDQRRAARVNAQIEARKAEAGVRLRELSRDAERRTVERRLARSGSPQEISAYRARVEAEDDADDLRARMRLHEVDPAWWASLGPATRRVLALNGFEPERTMRREETRARLDDLARQAEKRERPEPAWREPADP